MAAAAVVASTLLADERTAPPAGSATFYAAPGDHPAGDGSLDRPWDLQTALNQPAAIQPGATIRLRGGTYTGSFVSRLNGKPDAYINVQPLDGEQPVLDAATSDRVPPPPALTIEGSYVQVSGLEVMSSSSARMNTQGLKTDLRPIGINVYGPHTRLINNVVHDAGDCIGHWVQATDAEIYGNVVYFCGWDAPDRGHGHGLYIQNSGSPKEVVENIIFDTFGFGIHAYTEGGALDDLRFRRNVVFESGSLSDVTPQGSSDILVGGRKVAHRPVLDGNFTYRALGSNNLGYRAGTEDATVTGNYFVEGADGAALDAINPSRLSLTRNLFVGRVTNRDEFPDNDYQTEPHGVWTFILPNQHDQARATVVIYNWNQAPTTELDLSSVLQIGDTFDIRNVQDFRRVTSSGTFNGQTVTLPLRPASVASPIGWRAPASTLPVFGTFIVTRTRVASRRG